MHRSLLAPTAVLASAVALGCAEDQQSPMAPTNLPTASVAEHGTAEFGFGIGNERYTVLVGHTFAEVVAICEGTDFDVPTWDQLTVIRPTGRGDFEESFKQLTRVKDVDITVFEAEFVGSECDLLTAPHYEGTGRAMFNDNDLLLTHNGANASSIKVEGKLTDDSGQRYHLMVHVHQVLSQESTLDNFIPLNFFITIKLTPVGS